ncbi:MAG: hypothetical protein JOZ62_07260 [Acidobacteriaceae bacterium]|nr:hypothetical protein [Acidobacteriaceae bacterium]
MGLDSGALREAIQAAAEAMPEPLIPGQVGAPSPPEVAGLRPERTRISGWVLSVVLLGSMLAGCSTLYGMWQKSRSSSEHSFLLSLLRPTGGQHAESN